MFKNLKELQFSFIIRMNLLKLVFAISLLLILYACKESAPASTGIGLSFIEPDEYFFHKNVFVTGDSLKITLL
jgi:hypothetical protein